MLSEFKTFIMRGNVVDLAVGVIIGAAFGKIVSSLVEDIIMPPIGLVLGKVDFANLMVVLQEGTKASSPYGSVKEARDAGAIVLAYGQSANTVISFLIIGFVLFMVVRTMNRLSPAAPPPADQRDCPQCLSKIPKRAVRCSHCTAQVEPDGT
jgi:large conductance mechanosensitive channel